MMVDRGAQAMLGLEVTAFDFPKKKKSNRAAWLFRDSDPELKMWAAALEREVVATDRSVGAISAMVDDELEGKAITLIRIENAEAGIGHLTKHVQMLGDNLLKQSDVATLQDLAKKAAREAAFSKKYAEEAILTEARCRTVLAQNERVLKRVAEHLASACLVQEQIKKLLATATATATQTNPAEQQE